MPNKDDVSKMNYMIIITIHAYKRHVYIVYPEQLHILESQSGPNILYIFHLMQNK